ncbi:uncharacterized protein LOC143238640 [Tachypleus tridentatus]|uniref:uncharacterized protein LOC143238640 n=1 Tax=Tachypleus tridentatus TaxID=6853 RepID=UPI003FD511E0
MLDGKLDLSYKVNSPDPYFYYRALYILRPTLEISGKYTCQVMSLAAHDQRNQRMIVYSPAKKFSISQNEVSNVENYVSCEASGLYPRPEISFRLIIPRFTKQTWLQASKKYINITTDLYSIWLSGILHQGNLPKRDETVLECEVCIPETDYKVSKEISFYTGLTTSNKAAVRGFFWLLCTFCVAVFIHRS